MGWAAVPTQWHGKVQAECPQGDHRSGLQPRLPSGSPDGGNPPESGVLALRKGPRPPANHSRPDLILGLPSPATWLPRAPNSWSPWPPWRALCGPGRPSGRYTRVHVATKAAWHAQWRGTGGNQGTKRPGQSHTCTGSRVALKATRPHWDPGFSHLPRSLGRDRIHSAPASQPVIPSEG